MNQRGYYVLDDVTQNTHAFFKVLIKHEQEEHSRNHIRSELSESL